MKRVILGASLAVLLSACASTPSGGTGSARVLVPKPKDMVTAVRAAGEHGHELEVAPLRDPQVEDLRALALQRERQDRPKDADAYLVQALKLAPGDPDLIQWQAEIALLRKAWAEAERLANESYTLGPKLGGLCRRNWTTVRFARLARHDSAGAATAEAQVARCAVTPPVRM